MLNFCVWLTGKIECYRVEHFAGFGSGIKLDDKFKSVRQR